MQPPNHNQQARAGMINNKGNNMTQGMQNQNNNSNPNKQQYDPKNSHRLACPEKKMYR